MLDKLKDQRFPWQPMDSAPKGGTEILLKWEYLYHGDRDVTMGIVIGAWGDGYWETYEGAHCNELFVKWMPLNTAEKFAQQLRKHDAALKIAVEALEKSTVNGHLSMLASDVLKQIEEVLG